MLESLLAGYLPQPTGSAGLGTASTWDLFQSMQEGDPDQTPALRGVRRLLQGKVLVRAFQVGIWELSMFSSSGPATHLLSGPGKSLTFCGPQFPIL